MHRELYIPITYLGAERTFQLIRKRFYWPKTEEVVRLFRLVPLAGKLLKLLLLASTMTLFFALIFHLNY